MPPKNLFTSSIMSLSSHRMHGCESVMTCCGYTAAKTLDEFIRSTCPVDCRHQAQRCWFKRKNCLDHFHWTFSSIGRVVETNHASSSSSQCTRRKRKEIEEENDTKLPVVCLLLLNFSQSLPIEWNGDERAHCNLTLIGMRLNIACRSSQQVDSSFRIWNILIASNKIKRNIKIMHNKWFPTMHAVAVMLWDLREASSMQLFASSSSSVFALTLARTLFMHIG